MNTENYNELLKSVFDKQLDTPEKVTKKMQSIAVNNKEAIEQTEFKDRFRTPTADELTEMRQYAIDYKKAIKRASKREIREAVREKFRIAIIPKLPQ